MTDQQAAEYVAAVESAMQTARWAIPIDLARQAHDEAEHERPPFDHEGLTISGDHRPALDILRP